MALKKQTVWLLTMLSLIVVLSVYYVTSPSQNPNEHAAYMDEENEKENEGGEVDQDDEEASIINMMDELDESMLEDGEDGEENEIVSNISSSDAFVTIRMDLQASRDRMQEQLNDIVTSSESSAIMKSKAHDENMALLRLAQKEATLETLIKAKGYEDALVVAEEDQVRVIVQADQLTKEEANQILLLTFEQLGENVHVAVSHQP